MRVSGHRRRMTATSGFGGYLVKKGQLVKSWKRRYFFLSRGVLEYFENYRAFETNKRNQPVFDANHNDLDSMAPFRPKGGMFLAGGRVENVDENEVSYSALGLGLGCRCFGRNVLPSLVNLRSFASLYSHPSPYMIPLALPA